VIGDRAFVPQAKSERSLDESGSDFGGGAIMWDDDEQYIPQQEAA